MPQAQIVDTTLAWTPAIDGYELGGEWEIAVRARVCPGTPEYRPPSHRPDLYDPGAGAELHGIVEASILGTRMERAGDGKFLRIERAFPIIRADAIVEPCPIPREYAQAILDWLHEGDQVDALAEQIEDRRDVA